MENTYSHLNLQHWKFDIDEHHIAWWRFDRAGASVNTISSEVMLELESLIQATDKDNDLKGVIIVSAKNVGFIAGADIQQFTQFGSYEDALSVVQKGQSVFTQLSRLRKPTAVIIKDFCMGGGTELSLACDYRIAKDDPSTRIGLPEVKLGLQPGWGGTIRLPLLIGVLNAMNLILTGNPAGAKEALKMGMVDAVVPSRYLEKAAKKFILEKPKKHSPHWIAKIPHWKLIRPLIAKMLRKKISKHVKKEHYPAPYAIIDLWEKDGCTSSSAMENEAKSIAQLSVGNTAQNLIRVFFLQDRLKSIGKNVSFKPTHVHVVGAGVMGGDIAAWCALRGFKVTLQDREPQFIVPAIKRAYQMFKSKLKEPRLVQQAFDRLIPDLEGHGISKADIIIEAIIENPEAKQFLFKTLEEKAKPDAILATNTSGIPLSLISSVMKQPERIVGIHFFNPVAKMPLVEIVHGEQTNKQVIEYAASFVRQIDKLPLPVKSAPGFLVNRVLMPYMIEAMILIHEGVPLEFIDKAATDFGMPMGPVELSDTVGLDVCLHVAKYLLNSDENKPVIEDLEKRIAKNQLGRKTGQGFYHYKNNKPQKNKKVLSTVSMPEITDRLILRMINESMACLREEIVEDHDLLDAGMIFGTGFAPFRGGPIHMAESEGMHNIVSKLEALHKKYGKRFMPDKAWLE